MVTTEHMLVVPQQLWIGGKGNGCMLIKKMVWAVNLIFAPKEFHLFTQPFIIINKQFLITPERGRKERTGAENGKRKLSKSGWDTRVPGTVAFNWSTFAASSSDFVPTKFSRLDLRLESNTPHHAPLVARSRTELTFGRKGGVEYLSTFLGESYSIHSTTFMTILHSRINSDHAARLR